MTQKFRVRGRQHDSGESLDVILNAVSVDSALRKAYEWGMDAESVVPVLEETSSPPPLPISRTLNVGKRRIRPRWWVALPVVVSFITAPIWPRFTLWSGLILLILIGATYIPRIHTGPQWILRIYPEHPFRRIAQSIAYFAAALFLLFFGWVATEMAVESQRRTAAEWAREAERNQIAAEANEQLRSIVTEAETAWQSGDVSLANAKLESVGALGATDMSPYHDLRRRMADQEGVQLLARAKEALADDNLDEAARLLNSAASIVSPTANAEIDELRYDIAAATDPEVLRVLLLQLSEQDFAVLKTGTDIPPELKSGYDVLDRKIRDSLFALVEEVATTRVRRRQEEMAQEQVAAKAARAREQAAAEAARVAEQQRLKEERRELIEKQFSGWDGSHRGLTALIKATMHNPDSYDHVKTVYVDMEDHLLVQTTFRGTNGFGGIVTNWVKAKCDLNGNVIAVVSQGP